MELAALRVWAGGAWCAGVLALVLCGCTAAGGWSDVPLWDPIAAAREYHMTGYYVVR